MPHPISNLTELLRSMEPIRNPGVYVFASLPHGSDVSALNPVATVREREGVTVVLDEAVGLTAAFATALGQANISCNVVAGAFHDHIFVPIESADNAMTTLRVLQKKHAAMPAYPPFGG